MLPRRGPLLQEQCGDEEAAQDKEGIEGYRGPGYYEEGRYGKDDLHVGNDDDEYGHTPKPVPSRHFTKAAYWHVDHRSTLTTRAIRA